VSRHELFSELEAMLQDRLSPATALALLRHEYAADLAAGTLAPLPSIRSVERWRATALPDAYLLPKRLLEKKLDQVNVRLDLVKSLELVYVALEERAAGLLDRAAAAGELVQVVASMLATSRELRATVAQLGIWPGGLPSRGVYVPSDALDDGETPSNEEIEVVAAAFYLRRKGRLPPDIDNPGRVVIRDGIAEQA
jgi:hypothetical protein